MSIDYSDYSKRTPAQAPKGTWFDMLKLLYLSITAGYFIWLWFPFMLPLMVQLTQNMVVLSSFLSEKWTYFASALAPLTWFMSGYLACHLNCPKKIGNDEILATKFTHTESRKRAPKSRYHVKIFKDHGLHRKYPIC